MAHPTQRKSTLPQLLLQAPASAPAHAATAHRGAFANWSDELDPCWLGTPTVLRSMPRRSLPRGRSELTRSCHSASSGPQWALSPSCTVTLWLRRVCPKQSSPGQAPTVHTRAPETAMSLGLLVTISGDAL